MFPNLACLQCASDPASCLPTTEGQKCGPCKRRGSPCSFSPGQTLHPVTLDVLTAANVSWPLNPASQTGKPCPFIACLRLSSQHLHPALNDCINSLETCLATINALVRSADQIREALVVQQAYLNVLRTQLANTIGGLSPQDPGLADTVASPEAQHAPAQVAGECLRELDKVVSSSNQVLGIALSSHYQPGPSKLMVPSTPSHPLNSPGE